MSELKHLSVEQLKDARADALKYIRLTKRKLDYYNGVVGGQEERLKWIQHYLDQKESNNGRPDSPA